MTADRPVVFVVDDDARVRQALSSLLASAGLDVAVFASAHDDDVLQQALRDGAVAFLVKPFDGGELLEHVARAMPSR